MKGTSSEHPVVSEATVSTHAVVPVLEQHRFPEPPLEGWLARNLEGFEPPLEVRQFQGGMSNPTFLLSDREGRRWVMRKKPPGELLPSAHAVDREYRVITALRDSGVPVPRTFVLCEDASIIGTPFYVMEQVEGRVFLDPRLPELSPRERAHIYDSMNEALAALHSVDWRSAGLEGFGREGGYAERQIRRWAGQYEATRTDDLPAMEALMKWLPEHLPADDETTIVHGDYRLGNLVCHPEEPRVSAVLDWELSTLGHPLADLAYNCLPYRVPDIVRGDLVDVDFARTGIPSEAEYLDAYCRRTGREGLPEWRFFLVLSLFRLAAITQGVYYRGLRGNASDPRALERRDNCRRFSDIAWRLAREGA